MCAVRGAARFGRRVFCVFLGTRFATPARLTVSQHTKAKRRVRIVLAGVRIVLAGDMGTVFRDLLGSLPLGSSWLARHGALASAGIWPLTRAAWPVPRAEAEGGSG